MRSQVLLGEGSPERDRKQFNLFALDQADKISSSQLVPMEMHQGLIYPLLFAQSKREMQHTPIHWLSFDKPSSSLTAIHYILRHCSTDCIDPLKWIYEVRLPVLRKHENSRANRWTCFAQIFQETYFPLLLRKLQHSKFFTLVVGTIIFSLCLWTNKWILVYDLRLSKMCSCNVLPLAWFPASLENTAWTAGS